VVETIRLESGHTLTGIVGSNPTLSARILGSDRLMTVRKFIFALLILLLAISASAAERTIDPAASRLTVRVWKTGLFSAFAHNHDISAPITSGTVSDGNKASVKFVVNARGMKVLDSEAAASTRAEIEHNMLSDQVLNAQQYPEIAFESTGIQTADNGGYTVSGNLTLHGQTHPVRVAVKQRSPGEYEGNAKLKQTTFGIQPISIGGGAVKVKDEIDIAFTIVLR
jgi:polyisoprenoid-binding protein YceI